MSNAMNEMKPTFNYGQITQEHKDAAEEISNLLDNMGHPLVADLIKNKFEVTAKPKYNI
jgi:hypothetical protein